MKNFFFFLLLFFINLSFFSLIGITLYQLFCTNVFSISNQFNFINNKLYYINYYNFYSNINFLVLNTTVETYFFDFLFFFKYDYILLMYFYLDLSTHICFDLSDFYFNHFKIYFFTKIWFKNNDFHLIDRILFFSLHDFSWIVKDETSLIFFFFFNYSNYSFYSIIIYILYPIEFNYNLIKLQCFCFSNFFINKMEMLELPVIFFFSNESNIFLDKKILFYYLLILTSISNY